MTHSLDLIFRGPSKGDLPGPGIAQIYVKSYLGDEKLKGYILITPYSHSLKEFENHIDRLKHELEVIREKAKRRFAKKTK